LPTSRSADCLSQSQQAAGYAQSFLDQVKVDDLVNSNQEIQGDFAELTEQEMSGVTGGTFVALSLGTFALDTAVLGQDGLNALQIY
jgi:hypothetical protein